MIRATEIQRKANEGGVRVQQIEKDYVISWILNGIALHSQLAKVIAFKGGTVLKKVYFEDYRFSEDLDFTLINDAHALNTQQIYKGQIFEWFKEAFGYVREEANIPLDIIDDSTFEDGGINFYVSYIGPLGGQGNNKTIKIDISRNEVLVFAPLMKDVLISYSDMEPHQLLCYSLEEIVVEKMRSVMQRMQARDFYDLWYLWEQYGLEVDFLLKEFEVKCKSKKLNSLDFPTKLAERLPQYKARWQSSMSDQIHNLPQFEKVEREVERHLKRLNLK